MNRLNQQERRGEGDSVFKFVLTGIIYWRFFRFQRNSNTFRYGRFEQNWRKKDIIY